MAEPAILDPKMFENGCQREVSDNATPPNQTDCVNWQSGLPGSAMMSYAPLCPCTFRLYHARARIGRLNNGGLPSCACFRACPCRCRLVWLYSLLCSRASYAQAHSDWLFWSAPVVMSLHQTTALACVIQRFLCSCKLEEAKERPFRSRF